MVKNFLAEAKQDPHYVEARLNSFLVGGLGSSPFVPYLLRRAHHYDLKGPELPKYDDMNVDLVDYIMAFEFKFIPHKSENANHNNLFYRVFFSTLNMGALNWLAKFFSGCISVFTKFRKMLSSKFSYNCSLMKTTESLSLL